MTLPVALLRSLSRSSHRRGPAVVHMMRTMHVMMMMHVVMHVHHRRGGHGGSAGGSAGRCFLRKGITRETDRESGRGDKALNHRQLSCGKTPNGLDPTFLPQAS